MHLAQLPIDDSDFAGGGSDPHPAPVMEALDCLRVAVTVYDSRERLIYLNQHFGYLFRSMPPGPTLLGLSYADLVRLELAGGEIDISSYPDGEDAFVAERCAQLSANDFAPRDIHLSDGRIVEIKTRRAPDGGWIALWSDVTSSRHDFTRLESAIEMSADAFAFWDSNDRLVMCNPGFAVLHGSRPDESLTGITYLEMIATMARRGLVKLDAPVEDWIEKRMQSHRAPAGAFTVMMSNSCAYLVRERATRDGGHATVYTDVTDRHRVEAAFAEQTKTLDSKQQALDKHVTYLADLAKRLDKAEKGAATAKTTFLRTMSHELKTPLNAIIGFSDLLKSGPDHFSIEQIAEYAGLIHSAGGNLLTMLNQILDLTKIAADRYPLNPTTVSIRSVLDSACDAISEMAEDKSIAVRIAVCPGELTVDGDENALATMVGQLAQNAVKFTQNGGTITLSAEEAGSSIRIRVEDDGPGVATEDLPRIVEPFEQVGRDTAGHTGGGGLGLPLVKAFAELHGGTLTLDSALGEGFAATLDLPAT